MRSFSLLVPMAFATFALAQSPQSFNYQGVARDAVGEPLSAQAIGVEFRLRSGSALGPVVYSETHGATTDMFGLFTLHVGEGAPGTGTFSAIDWSSGPYFLEIGLDLSASGIYTGFGTQQLLSVPYALHAGSSGDLPPGTEVGQIMHWDGGAWVADSGLYVHDKRFGIGIQTPDYPLSLKAKGGKVFSVTAEVQPVGESPKRWGLGIAYEGADSAGLSLDELTANGEESRLFIQQGTGNVGIGAKRFPGKFYVLGSSHRGAVGVGIRNSEATENEGWSLAHLHDSIAQRSGSFLIVERDGISEIERLILRPGGNVGINEGIPDTRLHVSRPLSDPSSALDLIEGTGIVTIGPITDNIVADYRGIQARHGEYASGSTLSLSTAELNLQRLGGKVLVHGDATTNDAKVVITDDGKLGLGVLVPDERVAIEAAYPNLLVGMRMRNTASQANTGWRIGHLQNSQPERDGALIFASMYDFDFNDLMIRNNGNVGINEGIPDTRLHVSRPTLEPGAAVALVEGSGILTLGPMTDNIVADYRGIQARHGEFIGPVLDLTTSTLNLQRLGGDILIHGDDAVETNRVIITSDGKIGLGKTAMEKLEINGAIVVGNTDNVAPSNGTIRWNTASEDLEGFVGTAWTSLTSGGWEKVDNTDAIVVAGAQTKVGIGLAVPNSSLQVNAWAAVVERSIGVHFQNTSTTSSSNPADNRIGLQLENSGSWGGSPASKDIGLYVSQVSGQTEASSNIAAVINGNTVVGDLTGGQVVGTNGTNVLAIQNGTPPADGLSGGPGSNGAIQFYSADLSGVSTIHVMNGNGDVIKLYKEAPITPAQNLPVDGIYDPSEAIVIENMRTRITELENALKALGLLTP